MKKLLAVVIVGIFMLGAGVVFAKEMQGEGPGPRERKMERKDYRMEKGKEDWQAKRIERMDRNLNLTAEQKDKVAAIFKENDAKTKAAMDKAKKEMDAIRDAGHKKVKTVLTPEQAKKFDEMKAEMQKKMGEDKGKGRMGMRERHRHRNCPMMMEEKPVMEKK